MGIGPGYRHRGKDTSYTPTEPKKDPFRCNIKQRSYCAAQNISVLLLSYSDYDRLIVYKGKFDGYSLDPHFKENENILARFPATEIGYDNALTFVAFLAGGQCGFDWLPEKGFCDLEITTINIGNKR